MPEQEAGKWKIRRRLAYQLTSSILRYLLGHVEKAGLVALLALILSSVALYRQFFYQFDELEYLNNSINLEELYEGRQALVSISFALANTGTGPTILAGMCAVLLTPSGGTSYAEWWSDRQGTTHKAVLVEAGALVQQDALFYIRLYGKNFPPEDRPRMKEWPVLIRLELIDHEGKRRARTIRGSLRITEAKLALAYAYDVVARHVLPIPKNDESAPQALNCDSAAPSNLADPLPALTSSEMFDMINRRSVLAQQLFP